MQANPILLQKKYARIVKLFAERTGLSYEEAVETRLRENGYRYRGNVLVKVNEGHDPARQAYEKIVKRPPLKGEVAESLAMKPEGSNPSVTAAGRRDSSPCRGAPKE